MDKEGVITISNWQKGTAQSPYYGFANIKNCDIFETEGALKISSYLQSDLIIASMPVGYLKTITGNEYILTTAINGSSALFKNGSLLTSLTGTAWDIIEYKGYVIVSTSEGISCYGDSISTAFFALFKTGFTSSYYIKMIVGQDDKVYLTNGNFVATIANFVAGTFSVAPTCDVTLNALDLKDNQYAVTLQELGKNIMVGTQGGASFSERGNQRVANVYPWNRQAGTLGNPGLADLPLHFNENGIQAMLTVGNIMLIVAGTLGNVYKTDGTNVVKIGRIPWTQNKTHSQSIQVYPNAIYLNANNNLLIGTSVNVGTFANMGIWEMQISGNNAIHLKHEVGTLASGNTTIGMISGNQIDTIFIGAQTGVTCSFYYTLGKSTVNYLAEVESELYRVGTKLKKKTFQHLEFSMGKPLTYSQGLRFFYRLNGQADYIQIGGNFDYATLGSVLSHETKAAIADAELVQFKIQVTQDDNANPLAAWPFELLSVRIW